VTGDFHRVLARERARRAQDGEQHFIHVLAVPDDFAEMNRVRRRSGRFQRIFSNRQKTFVHDGERLRPGDADNGETAFAERSGNSGNGVIKGHAGKISWKGAPTERK